MLLPFSSTPDAPACATRLVNCYVSADAEQAIGPVLKGFPGISAYEDFGDEQRAGLVIHGVKYVVSGDKLYRIPGGSSPILEGTLTGSGLARPQMATNGAQVAILIAPDLWVYTIATSVLAKVTDSDYAGASSVQFIDNYLSFTEFGAGRWFVSNLAAATAYDSLMFATAEGSPDKLVAHIVDHREAFLLGVDSCEIWQNAGVSGFPFVRSSNGFVEIGCLAPLSAAKADQSIFWLASDGTVRRLQGVTPVRVSTDALDAAMLGYSREEAFSSVVVWKGHTFYVLTFPEATWALDINTGKWIELKSHGLDNWRIAYAFQDDGHTYVGDSQSGKIGKLDEVYAEWGDEFVMLWQAPNIYADQNRGRHRSVEVVVKAGVGLPTGQGSDPQLMCAFSDDGGESFTNLPTRSMGAIGSRKARCVWSNMGSSLNRVYQWSISDPVERMVYKIIADVDGGRL